MVHILDQNIGRIIAHYSDVIEGGNAYNRGTVFRGIPGRGTADPDLRSGDDRTLTATAAGTTTSIVVGAGTWARERWVKEGTAGYFLWCRTGATLAIEQCRRITDWDLATKTFTVHAFDNAPGDAATFTVAQGFKRLPNTIDINAEETESIAGYDRFFSVDIEPTKQLEWYGNGTETWEGVLKVALRTLKLGRFHDHKKSAFTNIMYLAVVMTRGHDPDHRDGTYVRALFPPTGAPEVTADDQHKIVLTVNLPIVYRLERGFQ